MKFIFLFLITLSISCSEKKEENISSKKNKTNHNDTSELVEQIKSDTVHSIAEDSTINQTFTDKKSKKKEEHIIDESISNSSENILNGQPINEKIIISKKTLDSHPDTLYKIAKSYYEGFAARSLFPVSIADDFEKGISKEKIHYTPVTFHFLVYEKESQNSFHTEKYITVKKDKYNQTVVE